MPAAVLGDLSDRSSSTSNRFQRRQRAALVPAHQAGVADDVHRDDRGQPALLARQSDVPSVLPRPKRSGRLLVGQRRRWRPPQPYCRLMARYY